MAFARDIYYNVPPSGPAGGARYGWSDYLEQVRDIAPKDGLLDRERELREMAEFCSGPGSYWWWQAEPWAGKSALMAWFVLHPPAGVTVASFFVTARYASQRDSAAFATAMAQQLGEIAGPDLPEATAHPGEEDKYFRVLLRNAVSRCQARGHRLVLVVDGLDEDHGPDGGMPSIASLLPKNAENGLKVFAAGRVSPRLPADVPADHPLRDPQTAHVLGKSRHALVIRDSAELELRALLIGSSAQLDLLGLLAAALGGLTLADLADLTGLAPFEIDQHLRGVTGRTVSSRRVFSASSAERDRVYLLAHEALQAEATRSLGGRRLEGYRDRLHAWADSYREQSWPDRTPSYLLTEYFAMLRSAGDTKRIIASATDSARHERLLNLSGADAAALAEIAAAQQIILAQASPDLVAMGRLARHRDRLTGRNRHIPTELPAVWAALGEIAHAEGLARSISDASARSTALASLACQLKGDGLHTQALELAVDAVAEAANSDSDPRWRTRRLYQVTVSMADAGITEAAKAAADHTALAADDVSAARSAEALSMAAIALAAAGNRERAVQVAERAASAVPFYVESEYSKTIGRTVPHEVIVALAVSGLDEIARSLTQSISHADERNQVRAEHAAALARTGFCDQAEMVARSITEPGTRAGALARICGQYAGSGLPAEAARLAAEVMVTLPSGAESYWQASVAGSLSAAGRHGEAVQIADRVATRLQNDSPREYRNWRIGALTQIAEVFSAAGKTECAAQAAIQAENAMTGAKYPDSLATVAIALIAGGLHHRAESLIETIGIPEIISITSREYDPVHLLSTLHCTQALTAMARELLKRGEQEGAIRIARRAESVARSNAAGEDPAGDVAYALAKAGMFDRAEAIARSIVGKNDQWKVLGEIIELHSAASHYDHALDLAQFIEDPEVQMGALVAIAGDLAVAGLVDRAEHTAELANAAALHLTGDGSLTDGFLLGRLSCDLAEAGMFQQAIAMAQMIADPVRQSSAKCAVAVLLAEAGMFQQAAATARAIADPVQLAWAVRSVAVQFVAAGLYDQALEMVQSIEDGERRGGALEAIGRRLAQAGQYQKAERAAWSLANPDQRAWALSDLATEFISAGMLQRAGRAAADADASSRKFKSARVLAKVAVAFSVAGMSERASQIAHEAIDAAGSYDDVYYRFTDFSGLVHIFNEGGLREYATLAAASAVSVLSITGEMCDSELSPYVLMDAVEVLAGAGFLSQAEVIARSIERSDFGEQDHALRTIVGAMLELGLTERAESLARSIGDGRQGDSLTDVARQWVAKGQFERAERAVRSIENSLEHAGALAALAEMLAVIGQCDQAETIACSIAIDFHRSAALANVVQTLASAGKDARARYLIAVAWTAGSWTDQLEVLGSVAPAALAELSEDF